MWQNDDSREKNQQYERCKTMKGIMSTKKRSKKELHNLIDSMNDVALKVLQLDPSLTALKRQGDQTSQEDLDKISARYDQIIEMLKPIIQEYSEQKIKLKSVAA